MAGQTWSEFRQEAFGDPYMVWHDGPDFSEFGRRWSVDPSGVEALLKQGLAEQDPLAAEAVTAVTMPPESVAAFTAMLQRALDAAPSGLRVALATSLHTLTGNESWAAEIVDVLLSQDHWSNRIDAAMALATFTPTPELIAALMKGAQDHDYLVRFHSSNTLLHYAGDESRISDHPDQFDHLVADDAPTQWAGVAAGLAGAASAKLAARS